MQETRRKITFTFASFRVSLPAERPLRVASTPLERKLISGAVRGAGAALDRDKIIMVVTKL